MLQQIKIPYFPNAQLFLAQSPLGATRLVGETNIYEKNTVQGKVIVRVDCLSSLKLLWGNEIFRSRNLILQIVTGYGITEDNYRKLLMSYYRRFKKFADYVDENILFGDPNHTFITNLISPVREILDMKRLVTMKELTARGGKLLYTGDEYVYIAFRNDVEIPDVEGLEVISKC